MMIMLRDDPVIEVFDSPEQPPSWIEAIDVENGEYQFCDDRGQRYVGVITRPSGWLRQAEFELRPDGSAEMKNVFDLLDRAEAIEGSDRFPDLDALREHLSIKGIMLRREASQAIMPLVEQAASNGRGLWRLCWTPEEEKNCPIG